MEKDCPCHSGKKYEKCCEIFHKSIEIATPVELMRSRYSAYALSLPSYIMKTTYLKSPHFVNNSKKWQTSILEFCNTTDFVGLEILSSSLDKDLALVTFFANLKQNGLDSSFTEKSTFRLVESTWLYDDGIRENGLAAHLI